MLLFINSERGDEPSKPNPTASHSLDMPVSLMKQNISRMACILSTSPPKKKLIAKSMLPPASTLGLQLSSGHFGAPPPTSVNLAYLHHVETSYCPILPVIIPLYVILVTCLTAIRLYTEHDANALQCDLIKCGSRQTNRWSVNTISLLAFWFPNLAKRLTCRFFANFSMSSTHSLIIVSTTISCRLSIYDITFLTSSNLI
jgi:hypothetical protein